MLLLLWLWLWLWLAAAAPIRPLAWEPPYAISVALKKANKQTKIISKILKVKTSSNEI